MKKISLVNLLLTLSLNVFSQAEIKKIYFLADTISISKKNKVLEIKWTTPFHYSFVFKSKYKAPHYNYLEFSCLIDKKNPRAKAENKRPDYPFISLKELFDIAGGNLKYFNEDYDLYITEALPDNKYRTYKVQLMPQYAPTNDGVTLKDKQ